MPSCCPLRTSLYVSVTRDRPNATAGGSRYSLARIAAACLRIIGWHGLEQLIGSIPRSNDDFGIN